MQQQFNDLIRITPDFISHPKGGTSSYLLFSTNKVSKKLNGYRGL